MTRFYFILLCLCFSLTGKAQEIYTLKRCLEIGLQRNYDIRIVRNQEEIISNNNSLGNAGYLPTLDLNAGYSGTLNNTHSDLHAGGSVDNNGVNNQVTNIGVNLNWMLFDGLKIQANSTRLNELQQIGELNTKLTLEDFTASLSAEYFNYVHESLRLKNLKYALSLSKERLRIVEARYGIGSMSRLDLQQARVDFNADSSNLSRQQEAVYTSRIRLNKLMAVDNVKQELPIADTAILPDLLLKEEDIIAQSMKNNTTLLMSDKAKTLSQLDYKMLKSRNYPYLKLNAGYGYVLNTYQQNVYDRQQTLGLNYGLTLGFNIFDGFNRSREQSNARLEINNRDLQYEQLQNSIKADLANIWMAYQNNLNLMNLEHENLNTAQENYAIAIDRYKLGDLSGIELREAQNSLLAAEERSLLAQYNTKLCEISLLQISGQILQK